VSGQGGLETWDKGLSVLDILTLVSSSDLGGDIQWKVSLWV
jgi:hypothetical protein